MSLRATALPAIPAVELNYRRRAAYAATELPGREVHKLKLSGTTSSRAIAILLTTTFVFFFTIVTTHLLTCAGCGQMPKAAVVLGALSVALFAVGCLAAIIGLLRFVTNVVTVVFYFRFSPEKAAEAPKKIFHGIIWFAIGIALCLPFTYLSSIGGLATN